MFLLLLLPPLSREPAAARRACVRARLYQIFPLLLLPRGRGAEMDEETDCGGDGGGFRFCFSGRSKTKTKRQAGEIDSAHVAVRKERITSPATSPNPVSQTQSVSQSVSPLVVTDARGDQRRPLSRIAVSFGYEKEGADSGLSRASHIFGISARLTVGISDL